MNHAHVTELYDRQGDLIGVLLSAEAWAVAREHVERVFAPAGQAQGQEPPEPLKDWEALKQFWDFRYPVDTSVRCGLCGAETPDWSRDEPRTFRLLAANLGGLVTFRCVSCKARVLKRHFKDTIKTETRPFQPEKDTRKEARYR